MPKAKPKAAACELKLSPRKYWWLEVWVYGAVVLLGLVLCWLIGDILWRGLPQWSWAFFSTGPVDAGLGGGVAPILISSIAILLVTLVVSVPVALLTAIALTQATGRGRGGAFVVRRFVEVLAGVPSIVFGLFGNALFCVYLGWGYSILSGGLTMACMVLPLLIRTSEVAIRSVPIHYRQAAAALGLGPASTLFRVVLPAAMPSLMAGLVLSVGRALSETAALIFTSGYVTRMPESVWDSGRSLSVHVYDLAMNVAGGTSRSYASAAVLVGLILFINLVSRWMFFSTAHTRVPEVRLD